MKQMSSLKWLWNQTRCHRLDIVTNSVVGIVRAGVSLSMVWVCKQLVDAATHGKEELLGEYLVALVICLVAQLVLAVAYGRLENRMEIGMRNRLESNLFGKLMRSKLDERDSMHSADLINRLEQRACFAGNCRMWQPEYVSCWEPSFSCIPWSHIWLLLWWG